LTNLSVQLVYCSKHRMLLLQCTIGRIRQLTFSLKHHYVITLGRKLQSSNSSYGLNGVGLDERLTMLAAAAISQCSRYHSHETASSSHVQAINALLNADVEKPVRSSVDCRPALVDGRTSGATAVGISCDSRYHSTASNPPDQLRHAPFHNISHMRCACSAVLLLLLEVFMFVEVRRHL